MTCGICDELITMASDLARVKNINCIGGLLATQASGTKTGNREQLVQTE
jgi:hypothetical protein